MTIISGKTRITGLFGYPVAHSFSPAMHNAAFEKAGLDFVYTAFPVHPNNLEFAVKNLNALGLKGVNVTIPHKENVIKYLDEISKEAELIGAVNTILVKEDGKLFGTNTDAPGFLKSVQEDGGFPIRDKNVIIFGAGGVSRAIAVVCALQNAKSIYATDIYPEKCLWFEPTIKKANPSVKTKILKPDSEETAEAVKNADLLINATPIGMHEGEGSPCKKEWLPEKGFAFDAIYNPPKTTFLQLAEEKGLKAQNGLMMLLYQGAAAFEIWTNVKPDITTMKTALLNSIKK